MTTASMEEEDIGGKLSSLAAGARGIQHRAFSMGEREDSRRREALMKRRSRFCGVLLRFGLHRPIVELHGIAVAAEAEQAVADKRKAARLAPTMPEQVRLQSEVRKLQAALEQAEEEFRLARKDVARERDKVLDEAATRLHQTVRNEPIFTLRWRVV